MPRKAIRIEPMNVVEEAPVEPPVEPLPERSNYIQLSDDTLTVITEEGERGYCSSSQAKTNKTT
jgi:hypothetical protein